jgi:mono/diheme cytochrome c family protein
MDVPSFCALRTEPKSARGTATDGYPGRRRRRLMSTIGRGTLDARLGASMLAVLALALPAAAQEEEGVPVVGQELATQLCTACHIVGTEDVGSDVAPPFPVIAKDPDMTLTELHAWSGPAHPVLPNLALTPEQIADINAYLDSLHEAPAEEEPPRGETEEPPPALEQSPPEELGAPIEPAD